MVTSGCPTMKILRPMVRQHLPFATLEETVFRSVSSYLLAQYFQNKKGEIPDWKLQGLLQSYSEIQILNSGMAHRIRSISEKDAGTNAVVVLDVFAKDHPDIQYYRKLFSQPPKPDLSRLLDFPKRSPFSLF